MFILSVTTYSYNGDELRKLLEHEAEMLRNKPVLADVEHFVMRYIHRTSFEKVKEAIKYGEIYEEGKKKYRATLHVKKKMLYVIFYDQGDYLEPITVGITTAKRRWG